MVTFWFHSIGLLVVSILWNDGSWVELFEVASVSVVELNHTVKLGYMQIILMWQGQ